MLLASDYADCFYGHAAAACLIVAAIFRHFDAAADAIAMPLI